MDPTKAHQLNLFWHEYFHTYNPAIYMALSYIRQWFNWKQFKKHLNSHKQNTNCYWTWQNHPKKYFRCCIYRFTHNFRDDQFTKTWEYCETGSNFVSLKIGQSSKMLNCKKSILYLQLENNFPNSHILIPIVPTCPYQ